MTSNNYLKYLYPILILIVVFAIGQFFGGFRKSFTPRHWLADVQYTHLAITENFQNGEGSILHPKTYILDPDGGKGQQTFDGLCEARFPLTNWIVAKFTHSVDEQIVLWRFISRFFFALSCAMIFMIAHQLTKNYYISILSSFGMGFTPLALFAQDSVGTFSLTFALILGALYCYIRFLEAQKTLFLYLALVFSGWAALQGHGTIVFLLLFFGYFIYLMFQNGFDKAPIKISAAIFGLFICGFLYNHVILYNQNGGVFELHGFLNGGIKGMYESNAKFFTYFANSVSNAFISICIFTALAYYLILRFTNKKHDNPLDLLGTFTLLLFGMIVVYFLTYNTGLVDFDLYLLESLVPALIFLAMVSLSYLIKHWREKKIYLYLGLTLVFMVSFTSSFVTFQKSFLEADENRVQKSLDNLKNADKFLDSLHISLDEKISLINGYGGNMALMLTKRKGYVADGVSVEDFKRVLAHKDSKYILSQDQFFMFDVVNAYPEVLSQLRLIASNETLSLYEKSKSKLSNDVLLNYAKCHNNSGYFLIKQNYEEESNTDTIGVWNFNPADIVLDGYKSKKALRLNSTNEFPCTYTLKISDLKSKPKGVVISAMFYTSQELRKVCFNTSCHTPDADNPEEDTQYFVEQYKISKKLKDDALNKWTRVSCKVSLPENMKDQDFIKIYLWNPHKGEMLLDNFSCVLY